ncbi:MAG: cytochrome c-type biogenesis protein CcmH [Amphiplicatus sp.]
MLCRNREKSHPEERRRRVAKDGPLAAVLALFLLMSPAFAVEPDEMLADPALEARAEALEKELRCVVCQSESLAESNAPLAKDMRRILREQIKAGASDEKAVAFLVDRYGDYVLLRPRFEGKTLLLWTFPLLAVVLGGLGAAFYLRAQRGGTAPAPLDEAEEARLKKILNERA